MKSTCYFCCKSFTFFVKPLLWSIDFACFASSVWCREIFGILRSVRFHRLRSRLRMRKLSCFPMQLFKQSARTWHLCVHLRAIRAILVVLIVPLRSLRMVLFFWQNHWAALRRAGPWIFFFPWMNRIGSPASVRYQRVRGSTGAEVNAVSWKWLVPFRITNRVLSTPHIQIQLHVSYTVGVIFAYSQCYTKAWPWGAELLAARARACEKKWMWIANKTSCMMSCSCKAMWSPSLQS